ncbi:MAG: hypothetical protein EBR82_53395 [Caulobacteraceae bacterium]|nr:hypothetical protein [Caulobacteraceae bacterium]
MNPQEKMDELIQAGKPLARLYAELEEWEDIKETAQTVISQAESAQERIKVQIGQEIGKIRAVNIEDGETASESDAPLHSDFSVVIVSDEIMSAWKGLGGK